MSLARPELIHEFYQLGLGELFILHKVKSRIQLCTLNYHKDKLVLKDFEQFPGMDPSVFRPCWEYGLLGALGRPRGYEWSSLTFYGLEHTNIPNMLTDSRHNRLLSASNNFGEMLFSYIGSVYRGFKLMMDYNYLPVVLLDTVRIKDDDTGLAVTDLRSAPLETSTIRNINDMLRRYIDKHTYIEIEQIEMTHDKFNDYFAAFLR